jgi:hypothetical protein
MNADFLFQKFLMALLYFSLQVNFRINFSKYTKKPSWKFGGIALSLGGNSLKLEEKFNLFRSRNLY